MDEAKREQVEGYALRLLARQGYSTGMLREKMEGRYGAGEEVESVVEKCTRMGYLNDELYAEDWVRGRVNVRPQGKYKLRRDLLRKKVGEEVVNRELEKLDEEDLCRRAAEEKWPKVKGEGYARKEKLMRFLVGRGFGYEVVKEVVDEMGK